MKEKNLRVWEDYLVLTMGRCTENFEKLPLVQDKALLDNILRMPRPRCKPRLALGSRR